MALPTQRKPRSHPYTRHGAKFTVQAFRSVQCARLLLDEIEHTGHLHRRYVCTLAAQCPGRHGHRRAPPMSSQSQLWGTD